MTEPSTAPTRRLSDSERRARYAQTRTELQSVLAGEDDPIVRMATIAALLYPSIPGVSYVGFYRVVADRLLAVGPYQGPIACLRIPFDRGVCGAAADTRKPQLVPDVHAFPGHIACDAAARSELVLPVIDARGELIGVLDLDSHEPENFDLLDQQELELLIEECFAARS